MPLPPRARSGRRLERSLIFFPKSWRTVWLISKWTGIAPSLRGEDYSETPRLGYINLAVAAVGNIFFSLLSSSAFLFSLPRIEYNFISMVHHQETVMNERAWMPKGKQITLPSFHSLCKPIEELTTPPPAKETRNHYRTTSVPSRLPSQFQQRLSMDVLLDAIELEQSMYEQYKHERVKSMLREHHQHGHRFHPYDRRRSKSAPGGSVSIQCTKQAQWTSSFTNDQGLNPQQLAESIAQKHIDWAKRK